MSAPAIPRRPVTALPTPADRPRIPWQGLFQEAAYADGQTYAQPDDEDDDGDE